MSKNPPEFDIHKVEEIYTRVLSMLMAEGYASSLHGFIYIYAANQMIGELIQKKLLDSDITLSQIHNLKKAAEKAEQEALEAETK